MFREEQQDLVTETGRNVPSSNPSLQTPKMVLPMVCPRYAYLDSEIVA